MGGGTLLAWPTTAASPQNTKEIHISNRTHKFQNKTGLDAKANSELYKSNRVCSVTTVPFSRGIKRISLSAVPQSSVGKVHDFLCTFVMC
jgi:hypothetical protein